MATLKAQEADVAILLPNSFKSAWLVTRAGIAERWGYAADFRSPILTRAIARPKQSVHQAEYYQHLVRELGFESGPLEPAAHRSSGRRRRGAHAADARRDGRSREPLVAIAPGAAYGTAKRWLPEHYASLVTQLVKSRRALRAGRERGRPGDDGVDTRHGPGRAARRT